MGMLVENSELSTRNDTVCFARAQGILIVRRINIIFSKRQFDFDCEEYALRIDAFTVRSLPGMQVLSF